MLYQSKTLLEFCYNALFYTHIDNGLWDIATVTMQYWNPEFSILCKWYKIGKFHVLLQTQSYVSSSKLFMLLSHFSCPHVAKHLLFSIKISSKFSWLFFPSIYVHQVTYNSYWSSITTDLPLIFTQWPRFHVSYILSTDLYDFDRQSSWML